MAPRIDDLGIQRRQRWLEIGIKRSSAQINDLYTKDELLSKQVVVVVNLLPSHQNPIDNEEFLVAENNMDYIHIPVDWDNPKETDFNSFVIAMKKHRGEKIFVHCAKNMRVSAFIYLYRILHDNFSKEKAKESMEKIWKPSGTWKEFIQKILD